MASASATSTDLRLRLDALERVVVVALYAYLLYRFAGAVSVNPLNSVYLVTEGVVMLMVLCRRGTDQISVAPRDWLVAFGGTFASMMIVPGVSIEALSSLSQVLLFAGIGISLAAKLQLRRSFGLVAANRGLKTTGVYALVRHPMYLGYFLVLSGMLMLNFGLWNVLVLSIWAALQILRINAEERVLALDPAYRAHMEQVRYRLLPKVY